MKGLEDGDVTAGFSHISRAGHSGRTRSDDADLKIGGLDVGDVDPAFADRSISDESLQPSDRDRFEGFADHADSFTLVFLRTNAPADRGQEIGSGDDVVGASEVLFA